MLCRVTALLATAFLLLPVGAQEESSRHFQFTYEFTVAAPAHGRNLRIWVPLAHSDANQTVKLLSSAGDLPLVKVKQPLNGNWVMYAETAHAAKQSYSFALKYDVVRREYVKLRASQTSSPSNTSPESEERLQRFLLPDRLVPVSGFPARIAGQVVQGKSTVLEKARALYDYVFHTMRYDKTGTGWGRGDAVWACDSKHGNCTDFHSLFDAMARSQHIPARFEIGFPLPEGQDTSTIPGYHCWTEFYTAQNGWVPVDISEAWKHPAMKEYFFGSLDVNRIQFTLGRDLRLQPPQNGAPLNFFIYPYVEAGGQEYANVKTAFSFHDVLTPRQVARNYTTR